MNPKRISLFAFLIFTLVYTALIAIGLPGVPFHPDESTYIFMSHDLDLFFQQPLALAWQPGSQNDPTQVYRSQDAPLARYLIGLGRWAAGIKAPTVDWDWTLSWQENQQAGALPSPDLLLASRASMVALFPLSLVLLFLTARRVWTERVAWISGILFASSALVLLHARRAMAESVLLFTTIFFLWSLVQAEKRPWLTGLTSALAFCAKHSLLALAPVGLLACIWQSRQVGIWKRLKHALLFGSCFLVVFVALNPYTWLYPTQALQATLTNRQNLMQRQVADRPEQALNSFGLRVIAMIGSLYMTQPIFSETGNYIEETRAFEEAYLANPFHNLLRSLPAGALLFVTSMAGSLVSGLQATRQRPLPRKEILLLAASAVQAVALLLFIQLPFQRYYLPLVPHACLWIAFGIDQLIGYTLRVKIR